LIFRDQVRGLGDVKGTRCDKENVIRAHHAVTRVDAGFLKNSLLIWR
jgi:hypothetical protein